MSNLGVQ